MANDVDVSSVAPCDALRTLARGHSPKISTFCHSRLILIHHHPNTDLDQHWIAPPAPRPKFYSAQDAVLLEDESGRVRLVGNVIKRERNREGGGLVTGKITRTLSTLYRSDITGVIMAALGMETSAGDFEVVDLCFAGLPDLVAPPKASDGLKLNGSGPSASGKGKAKAEDVDMDAAADVARESPMCTGMLVQLTCIPSYQAGRHRH